MFNFVAVKMVYGIVLEYTSIFHCIPVIMSYLYLCIWYYYREKFVIWWEKIPLLHAQMSPSYCPLTQIS